MVLTRNNYGAKILSEIVNGKRIEKMYLYYTETEAKIAFKKYLTTI